MINNPCGNDLMFTTPGPHYCFIHGRWGLHSADLPHVPPQNPYIPPDPPRAVTVYSPAKQTTKLRGNFTTIEEIAAAMFFAFMLGGAVVGLYVDFINKAHPCDPVPCKPVPQASVTGSPLSFPIRRFRRFP